MLRIEAIEYPRRVCANQGADLENVDLDAIPRS